MKFNRRQFRRRMENQDVVLLLSRLWNACRSEEKEERDKIYVSGVQWRTYFFGTDRSILRIFSNWRREKEEKITFPCFYIVLNSISDFEHSSCLLRGWFCISILVSSRCKLLIILIEQNHRTRYTLLYDDVIFSSLYSRRGLYIMRAWFSVIKLFSFFLTCFNVYYFAKNFVISWVSSKPFTFYFMIFLKTSYFSFIGLSENHLPIKWVSFISRCSWNFAQYCF